MIIAGADRRHDRIVRNPLRQVGNHLDGRRCQPFTADIYVPIPAGHRRQGDLGIDFGVARVLRSSRRRMSRRGQGSDRNRMSVPGLTSNRR